MAMGSFRSRGNIRILGKYCCGAWWERNADSSYSLGPPPYDEGTFFGHNNTNFQVTKVSGGQLSTQTMMEVPVTSQD